MDRIYRSIFHSVVRNVRCIKKASKVWILFCGTATFLGHLVLMEPFVQFMTNEVLFHPPFMIEGRFFGNRLVSQFFGIFGWREIRGYIIMRKVLGRLFGA